MALWDTLVLGFPGRKDLGHAIPPKKLFLVLWRDWFQSIGRSWCNLTVMLSVGLLSALPFHWFTTDWRRPLWVLKPYNQYIIFGLSLNSVTWYEGACCIRLITLITSRFFASFLVATFFAKLYYTLFIMPLLFYHPIFSGTSHINNAYHAQYYR